MNGNYPDPQHQMSWTGGPESESFQYDEQEWVEIVHTKVQTIGCAISYWNDFLYDNRPFRTEKGKTSKVLYLYIVFEYVMDVIHFRYYENHAHYMQFDRKQFGILNSWRN